MPWRVGEVIADMVDPIGLDKGGKASVCPAERAVLLPRAVAPPDRWVEGGMRSRANKAKAASLVWASKYRPINDKKSP